MSKELFSTNEAAELAGLTPGRVRQLILAGYITPEKIGRDHILTLADVEKLKARRSHRGPDKGVKYGKREKKSA